MLLACSSSSPASDNIMRNSRSAGSRISSGHGEVARSAMALPTDTRRELALALLWSLPRDEIVDLNERLSLMLQKDVIAHLPPEIAILILAKLDLEDLLSCNQVSRTWSKLCNEQSLWIRKCAAQIPPIRPAPTTWADVSIHRYLLQSSAQATSTHQDDEGGGDSCMEDASFEPDERFANPDVIAGQGGLGGGGGLDPITKSPLRRKVWERNSSGLPTHFYATFQPSMDLDTSGFREPPIPSHLPLPSLTPTTNYKHLYILHHTLSKRIRTPQTRAVNSTRGKSMRSRTIDAYSSIEASGLPGHSEAVYSLELIRHRMSIPMIQGRPDCPHRPPDGPFDTIMSLNHESRTLSGDVPVVISGRDWLLSGSRDRTLRLWQMSCPKPKVVKIFHGGHTGSVLSHFVLRLPGDGKKAERVMAVSGGSDGKMCLWDVEHGDGSPEKVVDAHASSVLCVRGDDERVVSCSKDRTIRVFNIRTLRQVMGIEVDVDDPRHRGTAVNAVGLSKDYIISASGDKRIRIWCIRTGALLASLEAHNRGIASVVWEPPSPFSTWTPRSRGSILKGTIVSGCSDASIQTCYLVALPHGGFELVPPMRDLTFREMLDADVSMDADPNLPEQIRQDGAAVVSEREELVLEKGRTCWASCVCSPIHSKPDGTRCGRCHNRGHTELVRSLHLQEEVVVSGGYDSTVRIWDRQSGRVLADLSGGHTGRLFCVVGDRTRVVSSGLDCRIVVWDFADGLDTAFVEP